MTVFHKDTSSKYPYITITDSLQHNSQTSIKRSPLDNQQVDLLLIREVSSLKRFNSYETFYDRTRKGWPFNTGDCLTEVTTWEGLTVFKLFFPLLSLLHVKPSGHWPHRPWVFIFLNLDITYHNEDWNFGPSGLRPPYTLWPSFSKLTLFQFQHKTRCNWCLLIG